MECALCGAELVGGPTLRYRGRPVCSLREAAKLIVKEARDGRRS